MPWKEVLPMEERTKFVMEVEKVDSSFAAVCRMYGISRRTGYKWWGRFRAEGLEGLRERSRAPRHRPNQSASCWGERAIALRERYPYFGPKKIRTRLVERFGKNGKVVVPAASTLGVMLRRAGLVRSGRRRRKGVSVASMPRSDLHCAHAPNEVWAADFKGWFRTLDGTRCDPLTVSDLASRYLLCAEILPSQSVAQTQKAFRRLFARYGMPKVLRVDNGGPFGSRGAGGLSRLSVWWMRLGIKVEFIAPGHPEQNGSHERMHRTLKEQTTRPPARSVRKQQVRFDQWRRHFNTQRPHEALGQQMPARCYEACSRRYPNQLQEVEYPTKWLVRRVRSNGQIKWAGRLYYIGEALVGQLVGLKKGGSGQTEIYFMDRFLGRLDEASANFNGLRPPAYARQNSRRREQKV
jgi:transposase InsO family protein